MRVAFRADASVGIGTGHVVRCLALAGELRRRGVSVRFMCREYAGHLISRIEGEGYRVVRLSAPLASCVSEEDAQETLRHLREDPVEWLVVDHYGLGHDWERRMRAASKHILVIDDLANRRHDCELLVDQGYFGSATQGRYVGLVEKSCIRLVGPQFALLQSDYGVLRGSLPERDGLAARVLVFFGGSDLPNDTLRVLEALSCVELEHLAVDVVVGQNHPDKGSLQKWVSHRRGAALHSGLPSLAGLMARADLAIGGGGSTTWERACLALPAVVVTLADNQKGFSSALAADGYQVLLGANTDVSVSQWRAAVIDLVGNPERLIAISRRCASLTDGLGTSRVAAAMLHDNWSAHQTYIAGSDGPSIVSPTASHRTTSVKTTPLRINLLTDSTTWLNDYLPRLVGELRGSGHSVHWGHELAEILDGDVCFIVGCSQLVPADVRRRSKYNLVVHESALPEGRGWSPMTWQVLEDRRVIVVTMLEAEASVDAGRIHLQTEIELTGRELIHEWRGQQARATIELCRRWVEQFPEVVGGAREQEGKPSFYRRRGPIDSKLDPSRSLADQFDLLRTVDNLRYPAFFEYRGGVYKLLIEPDDPHRLAGPSAERS